MCLTVKWGSKIEIAQKDIKVYKLINKQSDYWNPVCQQEYIKFEYCKLIKALDNKLKPIKKLNIRTEFYNKAVFEGFHSKVTNCDCITNTICIIPKGSQICYGEDDGIVSTQLIVFKNSFQYLMYKLKKIL